jgi:hypothetical protein
MNIVVMQFADVDTVVLSVDADTVWELTAEENAAV